uniref:RanBD1 domain-containing protein n=1 Tax=Parastrongyloides trichosuri TaxID=131310 RepID=A0A0N4ZN22_PARTI
MLTKKKPLKISSKSDSTLKTITTEGDLKYTENKTSSIICNTNRSQSKSVSLKYTYDNLVLPRIKNNESFKNAFKNYCVQEKDIIASRLRVKYSKNNNLIFIEWFSTFSSIFVSNIFLKSTKKLVSPIPTFIISLCLLQLTLMKKRELKNVLSNEKRSKIEDVEAFLEQVMNINDRRKNEIYDEAMYKLKYMMNNDKNFYEKFYYFIKKNGEKEDIECGTNELDDNSNEVCDTTTSTDSMVIDIPLNNVFEFSNKSIEKEINKILKPYIKLNVINLLSEELEKESTNSIAICFSYINAKWKNGKSFSAGLHNFKFYGQTEMRDFFSFEGECKILRGKDIEVISIPLFIEGQLDRKLEFIMIRPLDGVRYSTELKKIGEICRRVNIELNLTDSIHISVLIPVIQVNDTDNIENINFIGNKTLFQSCAKSAAFETIYDAMNIDGLYYLSSLCINKNGIKSNIHDRGDSEHDLCNSDILENRKKYNIRMDIPFHYAIIDTSSNHTIYIGSYFGNYVSNLQRIITPDNLKKINEEKIKRRMKWIKQKPSTKINVCCG